MTPRRPQAIRLHPELPEPRPIYLDEPDPLPVGAILAIAFGISMLIGVALAMLLRMFL